MSPEELSTEVQKRYGGAYLQQLTSDDPTETTIDTDRLEAAAADAIGEFERVTGISSNSSIFFHVAVLCKGTVYFLEFYKARDAAFVSAREKDFYRALSSIRGAIYQGPTTNSVLSQSEERSGARPDMDRSTSPFSRSVYQQKKIISE